VAGERRDFLFHCREASGAWRVRPFVDLGLSRKGGRVGLRRRWLLRSRRLLSSSDDPNARRDERERQ
jgi:hypothetical protein